MTNLDFYFDFGSPTAYLAARVLPRIADAAGQEITWRPMLLGGIFKATGNSSPAFIPAKGRWMHGDIQRFAARYRVPFIFNPHFPLNTLALMRGAVACQADGRFDDYVQAIYRAMWAEPRDMNDPATVAGVLQEAGFDAEALIARTSDVEIKQRLIANTEDAVARGVFGAPTIFIDDQMFFGQDRLLFVAEALGVDLLALYPDYLAVRA